MKYLFPLLLLAIAFSACKKKDAKNQAEEDEKIIKQYISDHGLNAIATGSGLYVVIDAPGTGMACTSTSTVRVAYSGYYTGGSVFDQSASSGVQFNLQNVIKGWTEGIPYFKEGGSGKLLIPSALGYGPEGNSNIAGNTVLIFDVELIEVL